MQNAKLLDCSPDEYHRLPGLSATIATTLVQRSPLHAITQHRNGGKAPTKEMDRGTILHSLVLGAGKKFEAIDFDSFRTKDARAARDNARAAGFVPVLKRDIAKAEKTAEHILAGLTKLGIALDGVSELPIQWEEDSEHGPVQCRAMFDHLRLHAGQILDLKITENADDESCARSAERFGYATQAAAYSRALQALRPQLVGRVDFIFLFCEPDPPFAINVMRGDGSFRELGERRWLRAVESWGRCVKSNEWPAYGSNVNVLSPPAWAMAREDFAA